MFKFLFFLTLWLVGSTAFLYGQEHPFLITKKEHFPALREKASREPWKSIKADALRATKVGALKSGKNAYELQDYIGALALAYVLEPESASAYAQLVKNCILDEYAQLELSEKVDWGGIVPQLGSYFVAILALDMVYNDLSKEEIQACEASIASQIFTANRKGSWMDIRLGTHGTWDIYKGVRTTPDEEYYNSIMQQITPDGVSPVTIHYAWERVGGGDSRISKSGYMDVLEFTGIDRRYYSNPRLIKFQRWLFGASVNNNRQMAIIGDMLPSQGLNNDMLHRRVGNFDAEAAGYAAWFHKGRSAKGHMLTYILPGEALPEPILPQSQWVNDGGASFREYAADPLGIHVLLYNIKGQDEWHTHQETNGLSLSGNGNRLLVNGGRLGEATRPANRNNTLSLTGKDHNARIGNGILEGLVTPLVDFAKGDAGPALADVQHFRNVFLLHGAEGIPGYVLLWDQVKGVKGTSVSTYLHPANESGIKVLEDGKSYEAIIDHFPTVPNTRLQIHYLTEPKNVCQEPVPSAVSIRYPNYPEHSRLEATYSIGESTTQDLLTLLLPLGIIEKGLTWEKILLPMAAGAIITHASGQKDQIMVSHDPSNPVTFQQFQFIGKALVQRMGTTADPFIFINQGRSFKGDTFDFEASQPVTFCHWGNEIKILIADETEIYIQLPEMVSWSVGGKERVTDQNNLRLTLPKGEHHLTWKTN